MSGLLLDTNVLSELTRIKPEPRVTEWLAGVAVERLHVSVLTLGKIRKGIALLPAGNRRAQFQEWFGSVLESWFSERVLPVDRNIADRWGLLTARAKVAGTPLAVVDATARGNRCAAQPDGRHAQQQALLRRWRAPLQSVGRDVTSQTSGVKGTLRHLDTSARLPGPPSRA